MNSQNSKQILRIFEFKIYFNRKRKTIKALSHQQFSCTGVKAYANEAKIQFRRKNKWKVFLFVSWKWKQFEAFPLSFLFLEAFAGKSPIKNLFSRMLSVHVCLANVASKQASRSSLKYYFLYANVTIIIFTYQQFPFSIHVLLEMNLFGLRKSIVRVGQKEERSLFSW